MHNLSFISEVAFQHTHNNVDYIYMKIEELKTLIQSCDSLPKQIPWKKLFTRSISDAKSGMLTNSLTFWDIAVCSSGLYNISVNKTHEFTPFQFVFLHTSYKSMKNIQIKEVNHIIFEEVFYNDISTSFSISRIFKCKTSVVDFSTKEFMLFVAIQQLSAKIFLQLLL